MKYLMPLYADSPGHALAAARARLLNATYDALESVLRGFLMPCQ